MTIPEKLKIGAKVYGVEITNKLDYPKRIEK